MIPFIYAVLTYTMLILMYWAGCRLDKNARMISLGAFVAVFSFTLVVGLRFGRGIDYVAYWQVYLNLTSIKDSPQDIGFLWVEFFLKRLGLPWQACVILMSFIYIYALVFFLRLFKGKIKYALPLCVLFTAAITENLARWYFAFSFILIGLYFQIKEGKKLNYKYCFFCTLGVVIHHAIIIVPLFLYVFLYVKKYIPSPIWVVGLFIFFSIIFDLSFFNVVVKFLNNFDSYLGKYNAYLNASEYWLNRSVRGATKWSWVTDWDTYVSVLIAIIGFDYLKWHKTKNNLYEYCFYLFLVGLLIKPISMQMELLGRYDSLFLFFRPIVLAYCLCGSIILKYYKLYYKPIIIILMIGCLSQPLRAAYKNDPMKLLFVWNSNEITPDQMWMVYLRNAN